MTASLGASTATTAPGTASGTAAATGSRLAAWLVPATLFGVALLVRLLVIPLVSVAPNEGAAYYVGVAANLVGGHGLVSDAVWSYATAPQVVPKPAFELWLPMATFVAALPMPLLGTGLAAAQAGMALLGALVAPLAWLVAREAAVVNGLDARRTRAVAITSGLLAAVLAPFVVATAGPDSTTPFLVFGTLAAVLMPRVLSSAGAGAAHAGRAGRWLPGIALGVALGLAWLSRQEAIWLGVAFLALLAPQAGGGPSGARVRAWVGALLPVVAGGVLVVGPWLLRDLAVFGSPFPGQTLENLWLRRNEDIFAWHDRPSGAAYLAQGAGTVIGDRLAALLHQVVDVLLLPPFPIGVAGVLALIGLRRTPAVRGATALGALIVAGVLTFLATALLFPVATQWGTYLHAAGPFLVALTVTTALGGDALLARISARRRWARPNVIIAPMALLAVSVPLLGLQLLVLARQSATLSTRLSTIAAQLGPTAGPIVTDHPMWVAEVTGRPAIALPDEPLADVADLARTFGARTLLVLDERGRYPAALLAPEAAPCLAAAPRRVGPAADPAWLVDLAAGCGAP